MSDFLRDHREATRRFFLQLGGAGLAAWNSSAAASPALDPRLAGEIARLEYLTPLARARALDRGNPAPSKLAPDALREAGLIPETWSLEVTADPASNCQVERQFSKANGTALDWKGLMAMAEARAVRYLHVCACTNVPDPFHMCLWEGVPLRDIVWRTGPKGNVRRVFYSGYHTPSSEPFLSSLPLGRVLEDPPGELPVIVAYKMNGQPIPATLGGPVRMVVPGGYGNRWVKWLQQVVLTNDFRANDTYAGMNNDVESPMKTDARFLHAPKEARAGEAFALTGLAKVGISGLRKVQVSVNSREKPWPAEDPYGASAEWRDATILPPPEAWGGGLPDGKLPAAVRQIDAATGKPAAWPLPFTIVHWAALAPGLPAGEYELRCRTIDGNGIAQPMPRPLPRTGANTIQVLRLAVKG